MFKKWRYCQRLLVSLCCICCVLFSNILYVNAAKSYYDLFENTSPVDESAQSVSLYFSCQSTSNYLDISAGDFSGTTTGGASSYTGTISMNGGTTSQSPTNQNWQWYGDRTGYLTAGGYSGTYSGNTGSVTLTPSSATGSTNINGSISFNTTHGGSMVMHYKLPYMVELPFVTDGSIDPSVYYGATLFPSAISTNFSNYHNISNFCITSADGTLFSNNSSRNCYYALGSELLSNSNSFVVIPIFIEFDDCIYNMSGQIGAFSSTITFTITPRLRKIKDSYQSKVGNNVTSDIITHELQEESNEIQEDTNETTHSIFDSITAFFGSFFNNLIGVFVPEDGYFTGWFNRVNQLLTDKLGILYYPFSVIIDIFTRLSTALSDEQNNSCPIVIPELGITIQGTRYVFLERQTIDLIDYNIRLENADTSNSSMFGLTSLIWVVRRFTSIVLIIAFMNMCVNKVKLILRGSEEA